MELAIVAGEYLWTSGRTEEQYEADQAHGIYENDFDKIIISATEFTFQKNYYYEHEDSYYNVVKRNCKNVNLEGTVEVESPSVWACTVTKGSYENSSLQHEDKGSNLTGKFKVVALPNKKLGVKDFSITQDGKTCGFANQQLKNCRELTRKQ